MEIVVKERGAIPGLNLTQKKKKVFSLIEQETDRTRRERLGVLARGLLSYAPFSQLLAYPEESTVAWLTGFLDFIEQRREPAAVRMVPLGEDDRCFLLTSTPDTFFLVDSIQAYLKREGYRFQVISHPIFTVRRKGFRVTHFGDQAEPGPKESFILVETEKASDGQCPFIAEEVRRILTDVLQVGSDRKSLDLRLKDLERNEALSRRHDFIAWLRRDNFIPFAYRSLIVEKGRQGGLRVREEGAPLGLPMELGEVTSEPVSLDRLNPGFREPILREADVVVETIDRLSPVHRAEPLIYLGFREPLSPHGWREHVFFGLFTQRSVNEPTVDIPPLQRKVERALQALGVAEGCYDHRKTMEIFNTFPKVELFFLEEEELAQIIRSFISLQRREAVKVVVTRGRSLRGLTLLVIMPREFYGLEAVRRMENYLCRYLKAPAADSRIIHIYSEYLSLHTRLMPETERVKIDIDRLERALTDQLRPWEQKFRLRLDRAFGPELGKTLWHRYAQAFPEEYRALIHPRFALRDVDRLEELFASGQEAFSLWGPFGREKELYRLQFYSLRKSILNDLMPLLENLNLCVIDEVDFTLGFSDRQAFIKSFSVRRADPAAKPLASVRRKLLEALGALRRGEVENDYLNRLLILTGLSWKKIDIFRGYRNYYFQLGTPFTKRRVAFALIHNPRAAQLLYRYFEARFRPKKRWEDPLAREEQALSPIRDQLVEALEAVSDINEDRILRGLFNLIDSTVRTNFYLRQDQEDSFFAFKISAIGIIEMPFPRPLFETYVHSAAMEGIHLRGGKVARGGIRWSDRPDDFRTEVLGLMKTQMTKNALIVPVGSKGGFVVKTPYAGREEGAALAKEAYKTLMRGLLDLTDNRVHGKVVRPPGIVAYDEDDPYLVVAADKGTAHLPDTANEISTEYGFWLGDAFASGGSRGYDHKKLGITARGAWECVKRSFRELGKDIQSEPFTVVGIGDMSGDVFGNGMLLSEQIRLLAAFDHRHIFLDPDPDPAASFAERKRLFGLPRSSWADYAKDRISAGGGVWPRSAKDIPLSPQVRHWLGIRHETADGDELIRRILTAPADLLWNGGIGTYVKAGTETNAEVGDRANDNVRVDASQVRARVVGEGGNLGFTQRARIEYALGGGKIHTDAVDNSAGVDTSDHEVNLKIFMQHLREKGKLASQEERDRILEEVTDEVCRAVLFNNYTQSLCLSLDHLRCREDAAPFFDLADRLVNAGLLNRAGEFLHDRKEILARPDKVFVIPELAILMAYSKMSLYQALLESDLPDHHGGRHHLARYFPRSIREQFGEELSGHPLARQITATMITNTIVDQAGSASLHSLVSRIGCSLVEAAAAYLTFDRVLGGEEIRRQIHALDNRIKTAEQYDHLLQLEKALGHLCFWALKQELPVLPEEEVISAYAGKLTEYRRNLEAVLTREQWQKCRALAARLEEQGFPEELAGKAASLGALEDFLPLVTLAEQTGIDLAEAARALNTVHKLAAVADLQRLLEGIQLRDRWDRMAKDTLKGTLISHVFRLARAVLEEGGDADAYFGKRRQRFQAYRNLLEGAKGTVPVNFHSLTVLVKTLEGLSP